MIGRRGEIGSWISVLAARHHDHDDDPWIASPHQLIADKVSSSVTHCYYAAMVQTIFTTRAAFCFIHKNVLPIFQQTNLIHKFQCGCNATYIGRTS